MSDNAKEFEPNGDNLSYCGKIVSTLNREELIEALVNMYKENDQYRKMYEQSMESKVGMMEDMMKLKFGSHEN